LISEHVGVAGGVLFRCGSRLLFVIFLMNIFIEAYFVLLFLRLEMPDIAQFNRMACFNNF